MEKALKVFLWLSFTVVFGMSPLLVRFVNSRTDQNPISAADTLKGGDLLIVAAVIAADAIGKIFGARLGGSPMPPPKVLSSHFRRGTKVVCGSACLILLMAACAEYAQVSGRIDAKLVYNAANVIHDSVVIFVCVVAAGLGVMLAVED
jgi:hypothetical protein